MQQPSRLSVSQRLYSWGWHDGWSKQRMKQAYLWLLLTECFFTFLHMLNQWQALWNRPLNKRCLMSMPATLIQYPACAYDDMYVQLHNRTWLDLTWHICEHKLAIWLSVSVSPHFVKCWFFCVTNCNHWSIQRVCGKILYVHDSNDSHFGFCITANANTCTTTQLEPGQQQSILFCADRGWSAVGKDQQRRRWCGSPQADCA